MRPLEIAALVALGWLAVGGVFWLGAQLAVHRFARRMRLPRPPLRLREMAGWMVLGPVMPTLVMAAVVLTKLDEATEAAPVGTDAMVAAARRVAGAPPGGANG